MADQFPKTRCRAPQRYQPTNYWALVTWLRLHGRGRDAAFGTAMVARWFPLGASRNTIVLDPARAFGRPIVASGGVPTEVLAQAVEVEGSVERVAKLYEVPLPAVRDALAFQRQLAA